jgi:sec-independent protein translocase protein TatB
VKDAAKDFNPMKDVQNDILTDPNASNESQKPKPSEDETYEGPVSR